jgi:hypothetical protein
LERRAFHLNPKPKRREKHMPQVREKFPQIIIPASIHVQTPEEAAKDSDVVLMDFSQPVRLTVDTGRQIHFPKGTHPVPRYLADHWWLRAHNVTFYKPIVAPNSGRSSQKEVSETRRKSLSNGDRS